jgi:RES domain-containing protein
VPADEPIHLDRLVSADGENDRWSRPGEPTVYLATELPTALAELARHLDAAPGAEPVRRRLLGLSLDVDGLLDIRRPEVRRELGAPGDPAAYRDREAAREVATRARTSFAAAGLIVPSMAFPDDPARTNLVLFMECLGGDVAALVRGQHEVGLVEVAAVTSPA